jgi:ketosteroid isomerase-like protein
MNSAGSSRLILSLAACVFMAGPLSAQTTPPVTAGGSGSTTAGGSAATGTAPAPKPVSKATQKELQDNLNAMDAAIKKKDINGVMKYFASDYKMKDLKGKTVTLSQIRDGYQSYFTQAHDVTTASSTVQKVEAKKDSYAVTGQSTLRATTLDAQNKTHEMAQVSTGLLTWKKSKTGWQITGGKLIAQDNTYDGKPYPASQPKKTASNNNGNNRNNRSYGNPYGGHHYHMPKMPKVKKLVRLR